MNPVEELDAFKLSHEMALKIYQLTRNFPEDERFALTTQMRRAAYSVPMNLAEGAGRLRKRSTGNSWGLPKDRRER